ncbi:MAG: amidoligase family protein [Coprococcus sp.]
MNEKTARQITEMKKQTIGVEVEMNNITRQKAAKAAAEFFGTGRYENTAGRNGYSTWSAWDAERARVEIPEGRFHCRARTSEKCELVTPILTYGDMETLQELIQAASRHGRSAKAMPPEDAESTSTSVRKGHTPQSTAKPCQHHGKPRKPDCRAH